MKFLCDQMLGTLAKWLRLLGFDTLYANDKMTDDDILHLAKAEHRMILSRDKTLIKRGKKLDLSVLEVQTVDLNEQLRQVLSKASVEPKKVLSRCSLCNTLLQPISKEKVKDTVPPRIFQHNESFWICPTCDKIYWAGTHYENILETMRQLTKK